MNVTLAGATAIALVMLSAGFAVAQDAVHAAADQWTQIGHGIVDLTGTYHHESGRALQVAWRHDVRQNDQNVLWVGTERGGLWKAIVSANGSVVSWVPLTDRFPGPHELGSFLVHRLDSNEILIGSGKFNVGAGDGNGDGQIYRTHDQGTNWRPHQLKTRPGWITRLVDDRADPEGNIVLAATSDGIYRSDDFGLRWRHVWSGAKVTDIVQDTADPTIWYAAASTGTRCRSAHSRSRAASGASRWPRARRTRTCCTPSSPPPRTAAR
jgi:hypothetical protein